MFELLCILLVICSGGYFLFGLPALYELVRDALRDIY